MKCEGVKAVFGAAGVRPILWFYFSHREPSLDIESEVKRNQQDLATADMKQKQQRERETVKVLAAHKKALRAAVKQVAHSSPLAATEHTFLKVSGAAALIKGREKDVKIANL